MLFLGLRSRSSNQRQTKQRGDCQLIAWSFQGRSLWALCCKVCAKVSKIDPSRSQEATTALKVSNPTSTKHLVQHPTRQGNLRATNGSLKFSALRKFCCRHETLNKGKVDFEYLSCCRQWKSYREQFNLWKIEWALKLTFHSEDAKFNSVQPRNRPEPGFPVGFKHFVDNIEITRCSRTRHDRLLKANKLQCKCHKTEISWLILKTRASTSEVLIASVHVKICMQNKWNC